MKARVYLGDARQVVARLELELDQSIAITTGVLLVPYTLKEPWLSIGNNPRVLVRAVYLGNVPLFPARGVDLALGANLDFHRPFAEGLKLSVTLVWHEYAARNDRAVKRELARLGIGRSLENGNDAFLGAASGRAGVTGSPNPAQRGRK